MASRPYCCSSCSAVCAVAGWAVARTKGAAAARAASANHRFIVRSFQSRGLRHERSSLEHRGRLGQQLGRQLSILFGLDQIRRVRRLEARPCVEAVAIVLADGPEVRIAPEQPADLGRTRRAGCERAHRSRPWHRPSREPSCAKRAERQSAATPAPPSQPRATARIAAWRAPCLLGGRPSRLRRLAGHAADAPARATLGQGELARVVAAALGAARRRAWR